MSYLTSNLVVDLHFWDQNTVDMNPTPKVISNQVQGGPDFFFAQDNGYTSIGATRFSSNSQFSTKLTADHGYYLHGYL
jgi:hypothetical protein